MSQPVERSSTAEALKGLGCGIAFGITSPLLGHPIDTVKTKMQSQLSYTEGSAFRTLSNVVRNEGFFALYRGLLPPLLGSSIYRSVQFSVYGGVHTALQNNDFATSAIPLAGGMQWRVLLAATAATSIRAIIETPLELIKVRRQTGQSWLVADSINTAVRHPSREIRHMYGEFGITWMRTIVALGGFFVLCDHVDRNHGDWVKIPYLGPFVKGGICATVAWWAAWPFEVLKNQAQANTPRLAANAQADAQPPQTASSSSGPAASSASSSSSKIGWIERGQWILRERGGIRGLYRGIGPGTARSLLANGSAMMVFSICKDGLG